MTSKVSKVRVHMSIEEATARKRAGSTGSFATCFSYSMPLCVFVCVCVCVCV